jgi:hypothetical protein
LKTAENLKVKGLAEVSSDEKKAGKSATYKQILSTGIFFIRMHRIYGQQDKPVIFYTGIRQDTEFDLPDI